MRSDHEKVLAVLWAYRSLLVETKRAPEFLAVLPPASNSKSFQNCVQFYNSAEEFGVSAMALMKMILDDFSPWWCQQTFKRSYPPVHLAVSEKFRNKALKQFPKTLQASKPDELVDFYVDQLKGYGPAIAKGLVQNGLCGNDRTIQDQVLAKLEQEAVK